MDFQDFKTGYYDAYHYTTKKDFAYIISNNHPADVEASWRALFIATRAGTNTKSMGSESTRAKQQSCLQPYDIYAVIVEYNIKSQSKTLCPCFKTKREGEQPPPF